MADNGTAPTSGALSYSLSSFPSNDQVLLPTLRRSGRVASVSVAVIALIALLGWLFQSQVMACWLPGLPAMKGNTAVGLVLLGVALRLLQREKASGRIIARLLAALAGAIAIITLLEYFCGFQASFFDQLFIPAHGRRLPLGPITGRMAPNTAVTILSGAIALFFLGNRTSSRNRMAHALAMVLIASGIWTVLCFIFNAVAYDRESHYSGMALNTAVSFVMFGVGVLCTRPGSGAMAIFSSDSASGAMARAILPSSILMLIAIGAATALGLRTGLYDGPFHNALFTLFSILLFTSLVWRTAHDIDDTERKRRQAEDATQAEQRRTEKSLRFLADASTVLATSLNERETLDAIAQLAVPKIADFCSVHLMIDGRLQLAAVSHMDPTKADLMVRIDGEFSPGKAIVDVAVTGKSGLIPEVGETELSLLAIDDAHRAVLRELRLISTVCVPLSGHRDTLGVITFASTEDGRRYSERDLALAEELGRRTALALDNNRLFAEVCETKVEAEAANAAKDQFLAVLSHELRTPLTPVLLCVEDLCRDQTLPPALRDAMEMTRRNIELEARLIDDLLDLTRIQRGKLQLQRVHTDAHALLRNAIEICGADIRAKNLCLSLGLAAPTHFVHADPARLQQVFWNLIKNAVKFTNSNGAIIFRSRNVPHRSGTGLQIEVEDSGIGIDSAFLPNVFNAFEQGEKSRTRRFGGLGLGLAISKNLVEAHGGTISVQSPGRDLGTKFTIDLDTTEPGVFKSDGAQPIVESRRTAGLRILLVEDNDETGTLLRKILERRGYHVDLTTTMQAALSAAGRVAYDLLLSDVGLPDGSGLELMQRLRETRLIPGIAMSGFGMDEDIRRSHEAGFGDHLTKPISIAKLEEAIEKVGRGKLAA